MGFDVCLQDLASYGGKRGMNLQRGGGRDRRALRPRSFLEEALPMNKFAALILAVSIFATGFGIWYYAEAYLHVGSAIEPPRANIEEPADFSARKKPPRLRITVPTLANRQGTDDMPSLPGFDDANGRQDEGRTGSVDGNFDHFAAMPPALLLEAAVGAVRNSDTKVLNASVNDMVARVRAGDDELIHSISATWHSLTSSEKVFLVRLLGRMPSEASVEAMLDIASASANESPAVRSAAIDTIAHIGVGVDDLYLRQALAQVLGQSLNDVAAVDESFTVAVASGLSRLSTAPAVASILEFLGEQEVSNSDGPEGDYVFQNIAATLKNVHSPDGLEPLQTLLLQDPNLDTNLGRVGGDALAAISIPEATAAILEWAAGQKNQASQQQAMIWLEQITSKQSLDLLQVFVRETTDFDPAFRQNLSELADQLLSQAQPRLVEGIGG